MFKNIREFWNGKDFLSKVLEDFKNMLENGEQMFALVSKKLIHNESQENMKKTIYALDKKINTAEKEIRKRIVEHLTIQPSVDVSTSLLLMSVIKDAERVGDYAKNLYEVSNLMAKPIDPKKYKQLFNGIEEEIAKLFKQTKQAFIESDEDKAMKSWTYKKEIASRCEETLEKLAKESLSLSVNEAVCFALMARHFKRISSHLTNIATSVILPITELDYYDEDRDGNQT